MAKLSGLTWPERRCLGQAVVMLPMTALALRVLGFRRVRSALHRFAPAPLPWASPTGTSISARQIAHLVGVAAQYVPAWVTCLPRALTLEWLLRRQGIEPDLRLGVRKVAGGCEAHAWVEHQGLALLERRDVAARFVPIGFGESLPGREVR